MKDYKETLKEIESNIQKFMEQDNGYYIHLGMDRKISESERDGKVYVGIYCYTMAGRYKGYRCGYVDKETGEYHNGKYDSVNAETMTWIGQ